jgi:hypothetical protein
METKELLANAAGFKSGAEAMRAALFQRMAQAAPNGMLKAGEVAKWIAQSELPLQPPPREEEPQQDIIQ